jgi:HAD superfamily hydrolase (TIGR01509 family)
VALLVTGTGIPGTVQPCWHFDTASAELTEVSRMADTDVPRRGVLFDVDGTLIDSTYLHAISWWQAFRHADLDVEMASIHRSVGMGSDKLIPHLVGQQSDQVHNGLAADHDAVYSTWWPALRPLPGARELVRRCRQSGLVTVLASSAGSRELDVIRQLLDVDDHLIASTSSEDADESKPAPDLITVALDKADLKATSAVMVGDSVWDVRAAAAAGVRCIGLECGGTSAAELRDEGAVQVFADPQELLLHWSESALADTTLA